MGRSFLDWLGKRSRNLWLWTPTAVISLGVAAAAMLMATHQIGGRHVVHYAPLERAVADLQISVSNCHLWLEEHLMGDPDIDLDRDVWGQLDRAETLARGLLLGGPVDGGRRALEPLTEPELRSSVEHIGHLLISFRTLARSRLTQGPDLSGAGSSMDQRYDQVYRQLLEETDRLERGVEDRMMAGLQRSNVLFSLILVIWGGIIAVAVLTLHLRRRSHRQAEAALRRREEQMRQSQKLEAVGRLAGGLAHDVNNYLATINTQCGLVRVLHRDQPGVVSLMDEVISTVGRTSGLIQRLLAFSRDQPVNPVVVDLNRLVEELGSMMRRLLPDEVRLERQTVEDLWRVEADVTQLEQVLVNLLVNAREAMPDGGRILLETTNVRVDGEGRVVGVGADLEIAGAAPGDYVLLTVADEGTGIPKEVRDKIFEPFFSTKVDNGARRGGHSGLGLATVYGIVRQAGGFLHLDSRVQEGSTFRILLPRSLREPDPEAVAGHERSPRSRHRPFRILVVEDNPDLRRSADAILTALGHEVETAADGTAGLERLERTRQPFDVVLTDLVMPGASGRQVARRALREEGTAVILTSGFRDRIEVEDLVVERRVCYLDKPFDPEALLRLLDDLAGVGDGDTVAGSMPGAEQGRPRTP